ncbi:glycoside hydrolase family 19 protein [Dysgonomonas macrotermitis]|uniref:Predicted chitinase n=1 Tax=Dysgonomonas macrotermitis TaxID=1346286 RepID=A0A1M5HBB8_9BACT|nr:glycoside hydrolase family 19 protein [Dysgonomonas macrotermitis]SHG13244.1 Predicted chitinase [Dysgonomonas macrotermitis]
MKITDNQLKLIYPLSTKENREKYLSYINQYLEEFEVNTPERVCAFLAQIGHESGQLRYVEEIASGSAYEGRKDLGNTCKGDGTRYKGRGLIQITGRANYQALSDAMKIDFVANPYLLKEPVYAVLCAFWYWKDRKLNRYATSGEKDFKTLTRRINGGLNGYQSRLILWNKAKEVLL